MHANIEPVTFSSKERDKPPTSDDEIHPLKIDERSNIKEIEQNTNNDVNKLLIQQNKATQIVINLVYRTRKHHL